MTLEPTNEPLTDEVRAAIDRAALLLSREVAMKRSRESYRDLASWLVQRTPMPLSYETQRVEETHAEIECRFSLAQLPSQVAEVLQQLLDRLPETMVPAVGNFELTVIEHDGLFSSAGGLNRLYISTGLLRSLLETETETKGDRDRLAFVIARLIAASCLGHARAWYQKEWASLLAGRPTDSTRRIEVDAKSKSDEVLPARQSSPADSFDQDLFAFHLCRQAEFDANRVLDVLRRACSEQVRKRHQPDLAFSRLRRLLMESRGLVSTDDLPKKFGLDRFVDGAWQKVARSELAAVDDAIVMIHGLGSDLDAFCRMTRELASDSDAALLGLRYPETDSLYRSSKFLVKELERVGLQGDSCDFVCHSAGGLVFRRAAEIDGLCFRTATLIGTPNNGSDLASLRPLLEAQEFFSSFRDSFAVPDLLKDDSSQLVRDLEPSSLFLSELNRVAPPMVTRRYRIVRGEALSSAKVVLLTLGIATAQAALRSLAESKLEGSRLQAANEWIGRIHLPREVRSGDLAVTLASATTQNPEDVLTVATSHTKLPDDPQVIAFIRQIISR